MISFFRRAIRSPWVLGLFALVLVAFLITGVSTRDSYGGSATAGDSVAKVGRHELGSEEVLQRVQAQIEQLRQRDPSIDPAKFVAAGGVEKTVSQLVDFAALEELGRGAGIAVSKRMVDGEIASIPAFTGPDGKFSETTYRQIIAQKRLTDAAVRQSIAGDLLRGQLLPPVAGAARAALGVARPYAALLAQSRRGVVGFVPSAAFAGGPPPSDAELQGFYRANLGRYSLGERRVIRYATFGFEQVANDTGPTDAEIKAAYDADAKTYAARDVRSLSQVVFSGATAEADARAFAAKAKAGSFAAAAGPRLIAVGQKTKAEFADFSSPAVADAAFAAAVGGTAQPARSDFGWHVVHVDAARTIPGKTLAQVRETLGRTLAKQKGVAAIGKLAQTIQGELEAGASFDDVARKHDLKTVTTPALLADGRAPTDPGFAATPDLPALVKAAFQAEPDDEPALLVLKPDERLAMLAVGEVDPAAPRPLAQVRDTVATDLTASRAARRARAVAEAIAAKVNAGTPMAQAIAGAGVALPPPSPIGGSRLDMLQKGGDVPGPLKLLFTLVPNRARLMAAPGNGGWYVVRLDGVTSGEPALVASLLARTRGDLGQTMAQEYLQQFAAAARQRVKPGINAQAVAGLKARLTGAPPQ